MMNMNTHEKKYMPYEVVTEECVRARERVKNEPNRYRCLSLYLCFAHWISVLFAFHFIFRSCVWLFVFRAYRNLFSNKLPSESFMSRAPSSGNICKSQTRTQTARSTMNVRICVTFSVNIRAMNAFFRWCFAVVVCIWIIRWQNEDQTWKRRRRIKMNETDWKRETERDRERGGKRRKKARVKCWNVYRVWCASAWFWNWMCFFGSIVHA